ncbi:MAG: helix-turn-helix domain-containing protein [Polaribacter sp.]|nr:helix-turn-helix domain-containing protein [Polaribacter sp.]MDG1811116.1 helix-turn-helix domain-containing protein [Polaribacter sp.]MDG1993461.1 helix-turn-helix domain-containing protein [Polaribacter sp.]
MIYDLVYLICITFSFFVGFFLWFKLSPKYFVLHIKTLAAYFAINALCFSFYLIIKYEFIKEFAFLYKTTAPITYLIAPAAYFHIRFLISKSLKFKYSDAAHLIPFFVFLISYTPFYLQGFETKRIYIDLVLADFNRTHIDNVGIIPEVFNSIGRLIHPIIYITLQWILIKSSKAKLLKDKEITLYKWGINFIRLQTVFFTSLLITVATSVSFFPELGNEFYENISIVFTTGFFFMLSIYLFWNQKTLDKLKYFIPNETTQEKKVALIELHQISDLVYEKRFFLGKENNLSGISKNINLSKNELSKLINLDNSSFNSWIHKIKIRYAKELIKKGYLNSYSIEALTKECGFNSSNTFYRAFKTLTNHTPKSYAALYSTPDYFVE